MAINLKYWKTRVVRYPLLVITGGSAILVTGLNGELSRSDWSGWVQAVGSIAALGIAIFVMSRQNRHAIRIAVNTDRRALLRRGEAVSVLIFNAHQTVEFSCMQLISWLDQGMPPDDILENLKGANKRTQEARAVLTAVPLHELGSIDMVAGTLLMLETMSSLCASIESWRLDTLQQFVRGNGRVEAILLKTQAENALSQYDSGLNALEAADF